MVVALVVFWLMLLPGLLRIELIVHFTEAEFVGSRLRASAAENASANG